MAMMGDRLDRAAFPEEYADLLIRDLGITPANFSGIKDALFHFRRLDDGQAAEVMREIAERSAAAPQHHADTPHRAQFQQHDAAKGTDR